MMGPQESASGHFSSNNNRQLGLIPATQLRQKQIVSFSPSSVPLDFGLEGLKMNRLRVERNSSFPSRAREEAMHISKALASKIGTGDSREIKYSGLLRPPAASR